jgi:Holliday junction resolvasome RuvABC endonuclease subunit
MIQALLNLKTLPSSDAADALAMAMAHAQLADFKTHTTQALETQL